jgi:hypothetical protein
MPERQTDDGAVALRRVGEKIAVHVTDGGVDQELVMGEHNAWRIFGMLAVMLQIPLSPKVGKAIVFSPPEGDRGHVSFKFEVPEPKTLGERVAQHLVAKEMKAALGERGGK